MGTNFYARIIPKEEDKQKLIDAINNNQYDIIEDLASELYGRRDDYSGIGNEIHLGRRSGGWKFLWNPNVIKVWDSEACDYAYNYVYPLTKEGITNFVMREDVIITDEYGETQDPKEFLEMAFNWCIDGLDGKEYQTNPKYNAGTYRPDTEREKLWKDLGYKPEYYNFYSDGLRFSTSINFS
jgi:hypothetical protein